MEQYGRRRSFYQRQSQPSASCPMKRFVDMDLGEMFLNFAMDEKLRAYAGMDITSMIPLLKNIPKYWTGDLFVQWNRQ
jgi:hypothetical protein